MRASLRGSRVSVAVLTLDSSAIVAPAGGDASRCLGLVMDSIAFLWLAFGPLEFLPGQVIGKAWIVLLSILFMVWLGRRDERLGTGPA